ncbi:MAG: NAD-dependent epimerase/dehydratase family protein [Sphingomonas adhaesiva]
MARTCTPTTGRVVSNLVCQALTGNDITVYGDGTQTRSFCYVSDMVEGLIRLMESDIDGMEPVNLGNPDEFTIGELLDKVLALVPTDGQVIHTPLPQDDPRRRRPRHHARARAAGVGTEGADRRRPAPHRGVVRGRTGGRGGAAGGGGISAGLSVIASVAKQSRASRSGLWIASLCSQ